MGRGIGAGKCASCKVHMQPVERYSGWSQICLHMPRLGKLAAACYMQRHSAGSCSTPEQVWQAQPPQALHAAHSKHSVLSLCLGQYAKQCCSFLCLSRASAAKNYIQLACHSVPCRTLAATSTEVTAPCSTVRLAYCSEARSFSATAGSALSEHFSARLQQRVCCRCSLHTAATSLYCVRCRLCNSA